MEIRWRSKQEIEFGVDERLSKIIWKKKSFVFVSFKCV